MLFEAKKRFQLTILNFVVTSNHIHLVVADNRGHQVIPRAMQLIAGRTGQEYNRRKGRRGAFWEDRYHATAIESGDHLWRCMVYVDLNMVRTGVVNHPSEWKWSGYHEIQKPKSRYRLIDHCALRRYLDSPTNEELAETHLRWIDSHLQDVGARQAHFSNSLAVGSETFVEKVRAELKGCALGRQTIEVKDSEFQLKEFIAEYQREGRKQLVTKIHKDNDTNMIPWKGKYSLDE